MPVARVDQGQKARLRRVALQNGHQLPALAGLQHLVVKEAAEALAGDAGGQVRADGVAGQASADLDALASAVAQKRPYAGVAHAAEPAAALELPGSLALQPLRNNVQPPLDLVIIDKQTVAGATMNGYAVKT